ncbi:MAG TPA: hypothetical protein VII23_06745 [Terriglobales bacterium]
MKRNLIGILALVVLISSTGAFAQSYAKASVPFAFKVGSAQLLAGTYEIKVDNASSGAILIRNGQTSDAAMSTARREYPRHTGAKLVFHHVGNSYYLAEVWKSSDAEGMVVPTSRQEKDLAKELQLAEKSLGGYEEVIIALN